MRKKIVAFAGSNSSKSINKQLVEYVLTHFNEDYEKDLLDLNDFEVSIYSIDRQDSSGFPDKIVSFKKHLHEADAIICSLAEHNGSYSTAFKNIFDWCSRIDMNIFENKPMLLLSTSPGGYGGGNVMGVAKHFFPNYSANIIETFSLPSFNKNFVDKNIVDETLKADLLSKIDTFKKSIESK